VTGLLPRAADALARIAARWVPDSFSIASLLTLVTFALGLAVGGASFEGCIRAWGGGVWSLLGFTMQIALVIFSGYVLAVSPPVGRLLEALADLPRSPRQAVAFTAFLSMALCWLNWGMGLIASAVLVRVVARRHPHADYRLLVAVAYLGMGTTWHGGVSGSVPLLLATPDSFMIRDGLLSEPISMAQTVFTPLNLGLMAAVTLGLTGFAALLHPPADRTVRADPAALESVSTFAPPPRPSAATPAERLIYTRWLTGAVGLLGLSYLLSEAREGRLHFTLDTVNLMFLSLAVLLHPHAASLLKAAEEATRPLHGVVLQFPLYAGIYGIIKDTGLDDVIAGLFLSVATARSFPFIVFWYSAVLDYFVPSGGGKWAIEALYVLKTGAQLGVPAASVSMAYAYGDMAANLIQPFWAIPLLGVARLEFRDILGYEILMFLAYSTLICAALLLA